MNLNSRGERVTVGAPDDPVTAVNEAYMNESIVEMQRLLKEVVSLARLNGGADAPGTTVDGVRGRDGGGGVERMARHSRVVC